MKRRRQNAADVEGSHQLRLQKRHSARYDTDVPQDNLQPGLRIQTQRRLTSLENDLGKAERRNVEKKNGGKYHMVKFFGESSSILRFRCVWVDEQSEAGKCWSRADTRRTYGLGVEHA